MGDQGKTSTADDRIAFALRRTDRVVTRFSNETLAPSGLSALRGWVPISHMMTLPQPGFAGIWYARNLFPCSCEEGDAEIARVRSWKQKGG